MGKCEKLFQKAQDSPGNLSFDEICNLAVCYGFVFKRQDGTSHRIYQHPELGRSGFMNFQSVGGKAKPYQVRQLLKAIKQLENLSGEDEQK